MLAQIRDSITDNTIHREALRDSQNVKALGDSLDEVKFWAKYDLPLSGELKNATPKFHQTIKFVFGQRISKILRWISNTCPTSLKIIVMFYYNYSHLFKEGSAEIQARPSGQVQ